ncbi:LacI family DNA-binding transcriptional regulator [Cohnella herbarum]|uniref:LacI family transcriptional regulator n=1 Tax=Cohnella herbarum TaxID=2728023 RepID=A0A7Z2VF97_9BACL|nr:LacI family DNA-binding transcriptional regulator [Cohnella herbarum]QJD82098.1 LacI family transcriptional regulator [Cohnella herbarum]
MKNQKVTIKDVARHAGVGIGSVSRVINNLPGVSKDKRMAVERSVAELGYEPDSLARSLRTQRTQTIAFFVNDISNVAFSTIAKGIHEELEQNGFNLLLYNTGNDKVKEKVLEAFRIRKFDGMIISFPDEDEQTIKQIMKSNIPFILLDREYQQFQADAVYSDYYNGIRQAVEYLISLGHTDIGFVTSDKDIRPSRESLRGYHDAMKLKGLKVKPDWIKRGTFTVEYGRQAFEELLREGEVTALIAGSNQLLVGCVEGVREHNIHVPKQLSLIGFEDSDFTRLMSPAITVVKRPLIQIGKQIAYMLLKRLNVGDSNNEVFNLVVSTELVKRDSCAELVKPPRKKE